MNRLFAITLTALFLFISNAVQAHDGHINGEWRSQNGRSSVFITKVHDGLYIENIRTGERIFYHKIRRHTYKNHRTKVRWDHHNKVIIVRKKHQPTHYYYQTERNRHHRRW